MTTKPQSESSRSSIRTQTIRWADTAISLEGEENPGRLYWSRARLLVPLKKKEASRPGTPITQLPRSSPVLPLRAAVPSGRLFLFCAKDCAGDLAESRGGGTREAASKG